MDNLTALQLATLAWRDLAAYSPSLSPTSVGPFAGHHFKGGKAEMLRGAYFLANDRIIERVVAFLNSFRRYNEAIPLRMIPFADDIDQLQGLQSRYDFTIWHDPAILNTCDEISKAFHGQVWGHYRKLALWEGEFDEFIYMDSDTVVLKNLDFAFEYLDSVSFLFALSDLPIIRQWVWKESIYGAGRLTSKQINFAASAGFVCSAKMHLSIREALDKLPAALELSEHMELLCKEQSFLNYLVVTSGKPYTSLQALSDTTNAVNIPLERHCNDSFTIDDNGQIVDPKSPPSLLVHWAGEWQALERSEKRRLDHQELWEFYRWLNA